MHGDLRITQLVNETKYELMIVKKLGPNSLHSEDKTMDRVHMYASNSNN